MSPRQLTLVAMSLTLLACTNKEPAAPTAPTNTTPTKASPQAPPKTKTPARIVTLAPNLTEIVFALGLGDRVVGVTRFCDHPPEVKKLPKIGGFVDPDMEAILAAKPDLILGMKSGPSSDLPAKLDKLGLKYAFFEMKDIAGTIKGIEAVGERLGAKDAAKALATRMAPLQTPPKGADASPKALFVLGHKPLVVAGPGTFGHELLGLSGAQNAITDPKTPYPTLTIERVLKMNPDVIIDAHMVPKDGPPNQAFWAAYPTLKAVSGKHVHSFQNPSLLRPGPRLLEARDAIRAAIQRP